jgi:hypothetical protein
MCEVEIINAWWLAPQLLVAFLKIFSNDVCDGDSTKILFTTQMAFHEYKTYARFVVLTFMFIANYLLLGRDPIFAFEMGGKLARDGVTSPDSAPVSGEAGRLASVMCLRLAAGARLGRMKYTFSLGISLLRSRKRKSSFVVSIK